MQQNNKKPTTYGTFENPNDRAKFAKHVIAVTSGKGGVGKSTVSANHNRRKMSAAAVQHRPIQTGR
jgi:Mrp family chromosome partitioning ATPase